MASYVTSKAIQNVVYSGEPIKTGEEYTVHSGGTTFGSHTGGTTSGSDTGGTTESGKLGGAGKIATGTAGEAPEGCGFGGGGPGGRQ